MINVLILLGGFVALIYGAVKLVDGASSLASKLGIPNIVIGLTIVAFGTSAPELVVNLFASVNNNTEIVLGNILGSNIFNVLGILGICAIIYPLTVKKNTTWIEIPLAFLAAVVVFIVASDIYFDKSIENIISRTDGLVMLLFFVIFLVYNIYLSKSGSNDDDVKPKNYTYFISILYIIIGLTGLIIGGKFIVSSAVSIAQSFGLSERVIGLTIVSIGTSLPELATSIVAVRRKNMDIAIGNVVGSNIFNIFFILGLSAFVNPIKISPNSLLDIMVCIGSSLLLFVFIFTGKGRKIERWEGILFLLSYIAYVSILVSQT